MTRQAGWSNAAEQVPDPNPDPSEVRGAELRRQAGDPEFNPGLLISEGMYVRWVGMTYRERDEVDNHPRWVPWR